MRNGISFLSIRAIFAFRAICAIRAMGIASRSMSRIEPYEPHEPDAQPTLSQLLANWYLLSILYCMAESGLVFQVTVLACVSILF